MIRPAREDDVEVLVQLIHDLAEFERSPASVEIEPAQLRPPCSVPPHRLRPCGRRRWPGPRDGRLVPQLLHLDGSERHLPGGPLRAPGGPGPGSRRALLGELATIAHRAGYGRVDWSVLDWNDQALRFYRSLGAVPMDEWTGYRLSGEALAALGSADRPEE